MENKIIEWFITGNSGISSEAIVAQLMGFDTKRNYDDHPHDDGDFGRCYKLLVAVPEFKPRISEMSKRSKHWAALVKNWDELTTLYTDDGKCYKRMQEIFTTVEI